MYTTSEDTSFKETDIEEMEEIIEMQVTVKNEVKRKQLMSLLYCLPYVRHLRSSIYF